VQSHCGQEPQKEEEEEEEEETLKNIYPNRLLLAQRERESN
jgi:hypothetical protein